jgi:hypothetical protein
MALPIVSSRGPIQWRAEGPDRGVRSVRGYERDVMKVGSQATEKKTEIAKNAK